MTAATTPSPKVRRVWWAMLALALVSRLSALAHTPLAPDEALVALDALDAARGGVWPASATSPLLLMGQTLFFFLFSPSTTLARLLPALAGVGVVMLPYLWRRRLGEVGALVASTLLLISPLTLFAARRVDDAALGLLSAGLLVTAGWVMRQDEDERVRRAWVMLGVGFGLIAGPAFYDVLLSAIAARFLFAQPDGDGKATVSKEDRSPFWSRDLDRGTRRAALWGVGIALLISTGLGVRWSGWSGFGEGLAAWLSSWRGAGRTAATPGLLLLYEPWPLLLLLTGLVMQIARREKDRGRRQPWRLVLWTLLSALLVMVRPGSEPEMLGAVVLPLSLYGGSVLASVLRPIPGDVLRWSGLHSLVSFVFWLPGLLAMAQYAGNAAYAQDIFLIVLGVVVLVGLQILLSFLFVLMLPPHHLWRSALLGLSMILVLLQMSFGAGLAYVRDTSPLEPAAGLTTSRDLRHLRDLLYRTAVMHGERRDDVVISVLIQDPMLVAPVRWTLRDFERLTVAAAWPDDPEALVITPAEVDGLAVPNTADWRGARFVATTTYTDPIPACEQLAPPICTDAVAWYLYRRSPFSMASHDLILWQTGDSAVW